MSNWLRRAFGLAFWRGYAIFLAMYVPVAVLFVWVYSRSHAGAYVFLVGGVLICSRASERAQKRYWPVKPSKPEAPK